MNAVGEKVAEPIEAMIAPSLESMGYDIVRVLFTGGGSPTLQVMAERRDGAGMTAENCAEMSRAISALLDVEDPITEAYSLEVSSPGIDRPLVHLDDYRRFSGFEAKIELQQLVDGRKRVRGTLKGVGDGDVVTIDSKGEGILVPYSNIKTAKLVLTDDLIEASLAGKL